MKILGIGVDIESVARFQGLTIENDSRFLNKIYRKDELTYCFSQKNPAQHLAARFAGKEAVIKAMSGSYDKICSINDVTIINRDNGAPIVKLPSTFVSNVSVHISFSHCQDKAVAFVVVQETGDVCEETIAVAASCR